MGRELGITPGEGTGQTPWLVAPGHPSAPSQSLRHPLSPVEPQGSCPIPVSLPLWISDTPVLGLSLLPQLSGDMRDKLKITKLFLFFHWMMPFNPTHELIIPFLHVQQ